MVGGRPSGVEGFMRVNLDPERNENPGGSRIIAECESLSP